MQDHDSSTRVRVIRDALLPAESVFAVGMGFVALPLTDGRWLVYDRETGAGGIWASPEGLNLRAAHLERDTGIRDIVPAQ